MRAEAALGGDDKEGATAPVEEDVVAPGGDKAAPVAGVGDQGSSQDEGQVHEQE